MKKFAVIGNPVNHSLSPVIHSLFAEQFNIVLEYKKIHALPGEFKQIVNQFSEQGGRGLNVTVPFKIDAFSLADHCSSRANLAQAVNTLSFIDDQIHADNTDGIGLVNDLQQNLNFELCGKRILILGAGGAVKGVIGPLLDQKPKQIVIANRTVQKAIDLENYFNHLGPVNGVGLEQVTGLEFDLVINATAASLANEVPQVSNCVVENSPLAYDIMYARQPTVFMQWANDNGAIQVADGLGMLVEQAAQSFSIWHNEIPDTISVLKTIKDHSFRVN